MQPSKCPHCGAPAQIPPATQYFTASGPVKQSANGKITGAPASSSSAKKK